MMTNALPGIATVALTLTGTVPPPQSPAPSDTTAVHHQSPRPGPAKHAHKWLSYDAKANTVTFKLVAGEPRGHSRLNFNGYRNGKATLVVPANSTVVLSFVNQDSLPHSAAVIGDTGPIPSRIDQPAIAHAATKNLSQGLPLHGEDVIRFTAAPSGNYRIVSGVPGQAHSGMWIRLKVDPEAKTPAWLKNRSHS